MSIVELANVSKAFEGKELFKGFSLSIEQGEMIAITGNSGSGKTTLLNMIGLLERCDSGQIVIRNQSNVKVNSRAARKLLRETISYLFQNFALVEDETVKYNLSLALKYAHGTAQQKVEKMRKALDSVGLAGFENKRIFRLSGGEQQRVAIARIILKPCEIVLADEPTGSLDQTNRGIILDMIKAINADGKTVIIVTHDPYVAECCTRQIKL